MAVDANISLISDSWWPQYFQDNSPILLDFIKIYYEFLETEGQVLYYARSHVQNRDIDKTLDSFLGHFKSKYLPDFQLQTYLEIRECVKNSLPFYRARGTDNAFQLFFREVFGVECEIYRPWDDIFSLSSGNWNRDVYLEISPFSNNIPYIGQEIYGLQSGATAFVDRYVRRIIHQRMVDVYYISAIRGTFATGEQLCLTSDMNTVNAPMVVGSMTSLEVVEGGEGFNVGDIVDITSPTGIQGKARVSSVQTTTGLVDFNFVDGGWGYGPNVEVYISNYEVYVSNVARPSTYIDTSIQLLGTVSQPLCQIQYAYANGLFSPLDSISVYDDTNDVTGQGTVLSVSILSPSTGSMICSVTDGDLSTNTVYYNQGNAVTANLIASGFTDLTANGLLLNIPTSNVTVNYTTATGTFANGVNLYQVDFSNNVIFEGYVAKTVSTTGSNGVVLLTNCSTIPFTGMTLYNYFNSTTATISSLGFNIGLQTNSTFMSAAGNFCYDTSFFDSGVIQSIASGYGASFQVANSRYNTEQTSFSTNPLLPMLNVPLNATSYGANLNNANLTSVTLVHALTFETANLGSLTTLTNLNPGSNYTVAPYVLVVDPSIAYFYLRDYTFNISSPSAVFSQGEIITQVSTGARGIVKYANTSVVGVRRLQFETDWVSNTYTNSTWLVLGESSGATANLVSFASDLSSAPIGADAVITANVVSSPGVVLTLQVMASGFGFNRSINDNGIYEDLVTFTSSDGLRSGTALAALYGQGTSAGYYKDRNGFLSSTKKLTDSNYFTPYSYDVRTPISPNLYLTMLKKLLHAAGKNYFTSVYRQSVMDSTVGIQSAVVNVNFGFIFHIPVAHVTASVGGLREYTR